LQFEAVAAELKAELNFLSEQFTNPEFAKLHGSPEVFNSMKDVVHNAIVDTNTITEGRIKYSNQYVSMLGFDRDAFSTYAQSARTNSPVTAGELTAARDSGDDLHFKALVAMTSGKGDVAVTAHTVRFVEGNRKEISGYEVWYCPYTRCNESTKNVFDRRVHLLTRSPFLRASGGSGLKSITNSQRKGLLSAEKTVRTNVISTLMPWNRRP
jgi:hypothetical protein